MTPSDESSQSKQSIKVLFLDVDGVINRWSQSPDARLAVAECVEHLNAILDATGAKVVVSASMRHLVHEGHMTLAGLEYLLRSHGVRCSVVGVTGPDVNDDGDVDFHSSWRGWLIRAWRRDHKHVGPHVVLDDMDGEVVRCGLNLVLVNGSKGLTAEDAQRAIEMLNGE